MTPHCLPTLSLEAEPEGGRAEGLGRELAGGAWRPRDGYLVKEWGENGEGKEMEGKEQKEVE